MQINFYKFFNICISIIIRLIALYLYLQEYVTADSQFIRIFHKDGRRKDIVDLGTQIIKLEYSCQSGHYIALVSPQELRVFLLLLICNNKCSFLLRSLLL